MKYIYVKLMARRSLVRLSWDRRNGISAFFSLTRHSITFSSKTVIGTYSSILGSPLNFLKRLSTSLGLTSLERDLNEKKNMLESSANRIIALKETQDPCFHGAVLFLCDSPDNLAANVDSSSIRQLIFYQFTRVFAYFHIVCLLALVT
jgi:hypothetical protein